MPSTDFTYPTPADGPVPAFNSIEEEAEFWDTHDLTDFIREDAEEIQLVLGPELCQRRQVLLGTSPRPETNDTGVGDP